MNYKHDEITIEQPVAGRYQISGFRAGSVYIPDVGTLAPPQMVDLAMSPDLAEALRAVLDDYQPEVDAKTASERASALEHVGALESEVATLKEALAKSEGALAEAAAAKKGGAK